MRKSFAIGVILFTLLGAGCTSEKSNQDLGIAAYKRGHYDVALYDFDRRANEGDRVAQFGLGFMYEQEKGVMAKNRKEAELLKQRAEEWYKASAEQGYALAQNNLAAMYHRRAIESEESEAQSTNLDAALQWFQKAAIQQNNPKAQYNLALTKLAYVHYNQENEASNETATNSPSSVMQALKESVEWFTRAGDQGYADAQYLLGELCAEGVGVDPSLTETQRWEIAVEWYRKAAEQGHDKAQFSLALMYDEGRGVDTNLTETERREKAAEWYTEAANQDYAGAQYNLAQMYVDGIGVDKNLTEAVKWYKKAADQNLGQAQNSLAILYLKEATNEKANRKKAMDLKESKKIEIAARLFFQAAQRGHAVAQANVGILFQDGLPGFSQKNNEEAYYWYSLALRDPDQLNESTVPDNFAATATERRQRLAEEMKLTPEEETEIRKKIDDWQPKDPTYWYGTGFYIDQNYILTNEHVVRGCDEFSIPYRRVELVMKDANVDLALLKDKVGNPEAAVFREDSVVVGEAVFSFGYPKSHVFSYDGNATRGYVSGLSGKLNEPQPDDYFQHTAPVQPGNSGGPVFDLSGSVVGVTRHQVPSAYAQNVNFAIEFDVIQEFLNENSITADTVETIVEDLGEAADLTYISAKARRFTVPVLGWKKKEAISVAPVVVMEIDDIEESKQ